MSQETRPSMRATRVVVGSVVALLATACGAGGKANSGALPDPYRSILHPALDSQVQAWEANRGREFVQGLVTARFAVAAALQSGTLQDTRLACERMGDYASALLQMQPLPDPIAAEHLRNGATLFKASSYACIRLVYPEPVGSRAYVPKSQRHAVEATFADDMARGMKELEAAGARIEQLTGRAFPGSPPPTTH